jgi:serine/threonine-protein kinase
MVDATMTPAEGQRIAGKYELVRPLARGGMGAVWIARHVELDSQVAVKFMAERLLERDDGFIRFKREAQAAARLKSVHVAQIHDYGVHDGMPYIAMELLHGEDLSQLLARRRLNASESADIIRQVCVGLGQAHAEGIVHRDLKPANIFLSQSGQERVVKILDFGIAKQRHVEGGSATETGTLVGSPLYMSPEQIRGEAVDHRSDLWSLGVVIYTMLTGDEPFKDAHVGRLFEAISRGAVTPPSHRAPELGSAYDAFIARALERARTMRFQSAADLSAAFTAAATGEVLPPSRRDPTDGRHTSAQSDLLAAANAGWASAPPVAVHPVTAPHTPAAYPMAPPQTPPVVYPTPYHWPHAHLAPPLQAPRAARWPWVLALMGVLALAATVVLAVVFGGEDEGETRSKREARDLGTRTTESPAASSAAPSPSAAPAPSAPPKPVSLPGTPQPVAKSAQPTSGRKPPLGVVHTCWKGNEGAFPGTPASSATISAFVDANGRATSIRVDGPARQHPKFVSCCGTRLSETNWGKGEHETMSFSVSLPAGS